MIRSKIKIYKPTLAIMIVGTIISLVTWRNSEQKFIRLTENAFHKQARNYTFQLQNELDLSLSALSDLKNLYQTPINIDEPTFQHYTQDIISRRKSIKTLAWSPKTVKDGKVSFPVKYQTQKKLPHDLKLDLYSNKETKAKLMLAGEIGHVVSFVSTSDGKSQGESSIIAMKPVYHHPHNPRTNQDREQQLKGYVIGVFQVTSTIEKSLKIFGDYVAEAHIFNSTIPHQLTPIGHYGKNSQPSPYDRLIRSYEKIRAFEASIFIPGQAWHLVALPQESLLDQDSPSTSTIILVTGIVLTLLISLASNLMVEFNNRRHQLLENRKLASLNSSLRAEALERRKAEEQAAESAKAREKFLSAMNHELRTPLNGIIGYSEIILEDALEANNTPIEEDIKRILESARILSGIIEDILDISEIESGKAKVFSETIEVEHFLNRLQQETASLIQKGDNTLKWDIHGIDFFESDPQKLFHILKNIVSNAAKFCQNGVITLELEHIEEDIIRFTITDTGVGIPEHQLENIFERFSQVHDTSQQPLAGTGLGLALTKDLAQLLGGKIYAIPCSTGAKIILELARTSLQAA